MSKYQEVMDHIKVDDEMKKRILQNVEKQLEEAPQEVVAPKAKVVPFRRYAAIAATFVVLLLGSYAVSQVTGGITNTSTAPSEAPVMMEEAASDSEAPAMEEAASSYEAPVMEEAAETAAEAPVMDAAEPSSATKSEEPIIADNSAQTSAPESQETFQPVAAPMAEADAITVLGDSAPVGAVAVTVLIAAFILAAIIIFVIKRKR